jgi:triacylglycerol lipase
VAKCPSAFNLTDAQTCASLVSAAYDQYDQFKQQQYPDPSRFDWTWTSPTSVVDPLPIWWIQHLIPSEPIGFLTTDGAGNAYLVFRGTMSKADFTMDGDFGQTSYDLVTNFGNVDKGYYDIYTHLVVQTTPNTDPETPLLDAINALTGVSTFFFTGHSLGAGLSSLAVPDVSTNSSLTPSSSLTMVHYNFGSPRVGDVDFASAMNFNTNILTYRVVNTEDIVPVAPPPESATGPMLYQHIGTSVDFNANYGTVDANHSMANTYAYAVNNTDNPYNSANTGANPSDGKGALSRNVVITPNLLAAPAR